MSGAVTLARTATAVAMRPKTARHGWHRLAVLAALMGFASISTDLYLPAMPAIAAALHASAGSVEWTISGSLIGFNRADGTPWPMGGVIAVTSVGSALSGWALSRIRPVRRNALNGESS